MFMTWIPKFMLLYLIPMVRKNRIDSFCVSQKSIVPIAALNFYICIVIFKGYMLVKPFPLEVKYLALRLLVLVVQLVPKVYFLLSPTTDQNL